MNELIKLVADFGKWISETIKNKTNAILLVLLSIFSSFGFIIATSLITYLYAESEKRRTKKH